MVDTHTHSLLLPYPHTRHCTCIKYICIHTYANSNTCVVTHVLTPYVCAGFDLGQSQDMSYFRSGEAGYHSLWDSRLLNYGHWEVQR